MSAVSILKAIPDIRVRKGPFMFVKQRSMGKDRGLHQSNPAPVNG